MSTPNAHPRSLVVSVGVQCHVGKERTENQDRVSRAATPFGDLFVVADGVGGYQGGSEAAQATVAGFVSYLYLHGNLTLPDALQQAAHQVNADLRQRSAANQALHGMGSTVVLCIVNGDKATYAHAGDSRAYLLRDHQLKQLTRDHSVMERMVSQGVLTPAQAREHPDASVLTRAMGQGAEVSLDIAKISLQANDALLLCSDGLWAYTPHKEMEAVAASESLSPAAVAEALLNLALEGGGGDNISIQFLRFKAVDAPTEGRRPRAMLLPAVAIASMLAIATTGMFVWNHQHPYENPASQSTVEAAQMPGAFLPPEASEATRSSEHKPGGNRHTTPAIPTAKAIEKSAITPPAPQSPPPTASTEQTAKTPAVIIQRTDNSAAEWAGKLEALNYLETSRRTGNDECLLLEEPAASLFYTPEKTSVALQVQKDLSLSSSAVVETSQEELNKCGGGEIIALPAKLSFAEGLRGKTKAGAEAAKTGLETRVDAVKKKAQEKVEPKKDKAQ